MKSRPLAVGMLLALATITFVTVGLELIARAAIPRWGARGIAAAGVVGHDPLLGWSQRPGSSGIFALEDFRVRIDVGAHGLRDRDYPRARVPGKRRVLLLGDSFAWGYGVEHDERIDEIVERRHPGLEIVNAAVPGYGTDQQLLYLERRGLVFEPDAVAVLFHPNDFENNLHREQYGYPKPVFHLRGGELTLEDTPVPAPGVAERALRFVRYHTYFPRQLLLRLERLRPPPAPRAAATGDDPVELTAALFDRMARLATTRGATFSVLLIPAEAPPLRRRLAALAVRLDRLSIRHVDTTPAFAAATRPVTFAHNNHWNPYGQTLAADVLERELVTLGLIEEAPAP